MILAGETDLNLDPSNFTLRVLMPSYTSRGP